MTKSEILNIVLAELSVILATAATVLVYMVRNARKHIDELRAALKLHKNKGDEYHHLIGRELQRTKMRLQYLLQRDHPPDAALLVTRLRASFLSAEQHARAYRENQEEFWQAMESGLKDMIALARLKVAQTTGNKRDAWQQKLDCSEQQINELALMRGTFSAPADALAQAQEQCAELAQLRELKEQHLTKIERLILTVAELRSSNTRAELPVQPTAAVVVNGDASPAPISSPAALAPPVFIRSVQEVQYAQAAIAETMQQIDVYQASSSQEVKRLKDVCLEQRSVIKKLREQLRHDQVDDAAGSGRGADDQAAALQRLLRDAEMCVQTLEHEITNLQSEISSLHAQLRSSMETMTAFEADPRVQNADTDVEARLAQFSEQNQHLRERIRENDRLNQLNQQMRGVFVKSFDCATASALMELLAGAMSQFGVHGALQIKSTGKVLTAMIGNGVESKEINLLNSVLVTQPVTSLGDDTILTFAPLKMLIKADATKKSARVNMGLIRELAEICAHQLVIIEQSVQRRDRQSTRQQTFSAIRKSLANIKVQWKYQEDEAHRVTKNMMDDVTIVLSTIDLTDDEEKRVLATIEETGKRLDVLFTSGALIDKSIVRLLQKMDEPVT